MQTRTLLTFGLLTLIAGPALAQPLPGTIISTRDPNGVYCREYQQRVIIGGIPRESYGTACQQPDGEWQIITTDQQVPSNTRVEYVEEPVYLSPPTYVVPPVTYYDPYPYPYYAPYYRNYPYRSGISVNLGYSDYHGGHHGHHGGWHH